MYEGRLKVILLLQVSSHEFELALLMKRDSATFWDKGTEVPSLSRDKGTTGQAKNLVKGLDGPGQPKSGTGRVGTRDKMVQSRKGCSGKDVVKQEKDVLKEIFRIHFVPGRSGIEEFSRDIRSCCCPGTERHREKNFFCHGIKGQR